MPIEELSPDEIETKQNALLEKIPATGAIGNKALREKLEGWTDDLYWAIRNRLIERGTLETGRGKGGSVRRVTTSLPAEGVPEETREARGTEATLCVVAEYARESDLYTPVSDVLRNQWAKEQGFDAYLVEITAKQGSRQTGGKWTRPDVTVVGYKTFPYVPGRFLEVVTFEIKHSTTADVSAVYEAVAHRRAATRAYVIAHIPEENRQDYDNEDTIDALVNEAKKIGVGIIVADNPTDFDTWEVNLEAERFEPDPSRLNEFIAQQTSNELKEQIVRWFK